MLAAVAPPTNSDRDYDLYSGTSMAAPHIAGLAAFMQGLHPDWTPQEIQSAMLTTAKPTRDSEGAKSTDALAQGAGIVNPKKFLDPGWFISSSAREWRGFLTGQGLDTGVPTVFGVLTTEDMAQAVERAAVDRGDKGADCADAAVELVQLLRRLG